MDLATIEKEALAELDQAKTLTELEHIHIRYLGRKEGQLTQILRSLGTLSPEEKKRLGQAANQLKIKLEERITGLKGSLKNAELDSNVQSSQIDPTLPGVIRPLGSTHPIVYAIEEISAIFSSLGFESVEGPDVESDFNNFAALNFPPEHPARDSHDTFYLNMPSQPLLRTHTSPVQIRLMQSVKPPIRVIAPGRVFRHEAVDATHAAIFHQIEGLAVDENISFSDLKGTLQFFAKRYFGSKVRVRFRPSYFPFVEPGAEIDVLCFVCFGEKRLPDGRSCNICKASGWIEMGGAGMVHPNVFRAVGYNPKKVQGFAFGIGVERIVMARTGIKDIRHFLESDMRFLEQFQ